MKLLHTVIILNRHSSDLLKEYRFLFQPFADEGTVSFCDWNESGSDVMSSVPDLYKLIRGRKDWRAVIVNTDCLREISDPQLIPLGENPFDFINASAEDDRGVPSESSVPLIRLTHMIGGYEPTKEEYSEAYKEYKKCYK